MKTKIIKVTTVFVWIILWQILSMVTNNEIFLAAPYTVFMQLIKMLLLFEFWFSVFFSFIRIAGGFFFATLVGIFIAGLSYRFTWLKTFLWPLVSVVKTAPVVSFIILFLILVSSVNLSILISFLMVFPIIYGNVLKGLENTDAKLLQMSKIFRMKTMKKILYIYLPSVYPFFFTACQVGLGLCWKSGITAELIGTPTGSIGEKLYQAKLYLDTGSLFAWTVVIIVVSVAFEKVLLKILREGIHRFERI